MRAAGGAGAILTAYDIWLWLNQPVGEAVEDRLTFWAGEAGVWNYDPDFGGAPVVMPGNTGTTEYIVMPKGRQTGGPPALGEYVWTIVSTIPPGSVANIAQWTAAGRQPFIVHRDEVTTTANPFPTSPTTAYFRNLVVGAAGLNLPFNSQLVLTLRITRQAGHPLNIANVRIPNATYWQSQPLPWEFGNTPLANPHNAVTSPAPRPIWYAPPRPSPWTPEFPQVGNARVDFKPAPRPEPSFGHVLTPGAKPQPISPRGPQPPGPRTKERKAGLPPWAAFAWRAANPITETNDAISAIYEALSRKIKIAEYKKRGRQPTPQEKLMILYANINSLNVGQAVSNLIVEAAEDRFYGRAGQALRDAGRNMYPDRPIGLGAGPAF